MRLTPTTNPPPSPASAAPPPSRILIADDQADVLAALRLLLKAEGFAVATAGSPAAALAALEGGEFDALLMDMNYARDTTSGSEGLDLLARVRALDPTLPVVVMTAWGTVDGAVAAMQRGARDYVQKPWDNARLLATLRTQIELAGALRATRRLAAESSRLREQTLPELLAASRAMQAVLALLQKVAPSDANVLVTGEHGTGKEVVARWVHAASQRAGRAFVPVNAGALADGVFESELFGHVKGAFTDARADRAGCFELASGGTLFLDEIGTMPPGQQAKLLRVLQTGEYQPVGSSRVRHADVRLIAATNVDIAAEVRRGAFREDLLYRLNTVEVRLPPLRERREDVPLLAATFLRRSAQRYGKAGALEGFSAEAAGALLEHAWPGNVRELEHVVERAVLLADGPCVEPEHLALSRAAPAAPAYETMTLEQAEAYLIRKALDRAEGNVLEAARALGLSRSAFYRRMAQHGIRVGG